MQFNMRNKNKRHEARVNTWVRLFFDAQKKSAGVQHTGTISSEIHIRLQLRYRFILRSLYAMIPLIQARSSAVDPTENRVSVLLEVPAEDPRPP
jgi:hypothetical protein